MQNIAVHILGSKMFQRTGHRLGDLRRKAGLGIVGQTMILPASIGEFGLQEELRAGGHSSAIRCGQTRADSGLRSSGVAG